MRTRPAIQAPLAEAQLRQAQAAADKDKVNLGYTVIRSPVSGIVVDRVIDLARRSPPATRRRP